MLDALNLLYLAVTVGSQALNIVANADSDIQIKENVRVYAISMTQQAPFWVNKCHYDGVMVEFSRDWPEIDQSTGVVLPPAPDKPFGYALILTKERCPGKVEQNIFSTDDKHFSPFFGRGKYVIRDGNRMDAVDYASQKEDFRPKWMPQVLKTIQAEASSNVAAKNFETELAARTADATNAEKDKNPQALAPVEALAGTSEVQETKPGE
jgi:hypothetical protein